MKPCEDCATKAYCDFDGICWLEERLREERAQQERTRANTTRKHSVEKALKPRGRRR